MQKRLQAGEPGRARAPSPPGDVAARPSSMSSDARPLPGRPATAYLRRKFKCKGKRLAHSVGRARGGGRALGTAGSHLTGRQIALFFWSSEASSESTAQRRRQPARAMSTPWRGRQISTSTHLVEEEKERLRGRRAGLHTLRVCRRQLRRRRRRQGKKSETEGRRSFLQTQTPNQPRPHTNTPTASPGQMPRGGSPLPALVLLVSLSRTPQNPIPSQKTEVPGCLRPAFFIFIIRRAVRRAQTRATPLAGEKAHARTHIQTLTPTLYIFHPFKPPRTP
jgi:hypothetical protein